MNQIAPLDTSSSAQLLKYEAACRALAEARSVDEAKGFRDHAEAMRAYARQAKNRQLEIDAAEIRIRAERRIGELMAAQREARLLSKGAADTGGPGRGNAGPMPTHVFADAPITLSEAGIDKHLADRARKLAAVPETEFEGRVQEWRDEVQAANERVTVNLLQSGEKHVRGTFGTGENEWYTPDEHIEKARLVLGGIDLDPASSEIANRTVKAARIFTIDDDGLNQEWAGRVWMNPPYAQPAIAHFADKIVSEWQAQRLTAAIALTHNYTDTAWFQKMARAADAICFTRGRVRFVSPSGQLAAPTQGQAFFYFGNDVEAFAKAFAETGFVVRVV